MGKLDNPEKDASPTDFTNICLVADDRNNADNNKIQTTGVSVTPEVKTLPEDSGRKTSRDSETGSDKSDTETLDIGFLQLFRYTDRFDKFLLLLGAIMALGWGSGLPIHFLIYGYVADAFIKNQLYHNLLNSMRNISSNLSIIPVNLSEEYLLSQAKVAELEDYSDAYAAVTKYVLYFILVGIMVFITSSVSIFCWVYAAERQIRKIRAGFFESVLRQPIGWFDTHEGSQLNTRFVEDMQLIFDGMGDKVVLLIQYTTNFFLGYIVAFLSGWEITLIILPFSPALIITGAIVTKLVRNFAQKESEAYAGAGSVAEESLHAIRTVTVFNGQEKECERYCSKLYVAKSTAIGKGIFFGLGWAIIWIFLYGILSTAFWYGIKLFREDDNLEPGRTVTVFIAVVAGSMSMGQAFPSFEIIGNARGAASRIYKIMKMKSSIDCLSAEGEKPATSEGNIELKNVSFTYPARPDCQVLKNLSLKVKVGTTTALVGASGCGKSTIVQLVQRFYDPYEGEVYFDGKDVTTLNVRWLREQIGVVSQEPVLFGTTITENIRYGRLEVTMADIVTAAKEANVHDFISKLPEGYNTVIGQRGSQLSGGQKQRIAIARALVRNPKILLLDEATSALDNESEAIVQKALEKAAKGRTTIIVAHRLSTIQNADIILGIRDGEVVEQGTHDELLAAQGLYTALVQQQSHLTTDEEEVLEQLQHEVLEVCEDGDNDTSTLTRQRSIKSPHKQHVPLATHRSLSQNSTAAAPEKKEEDTSNVTMKRVIGLNSPEWPYLVGGSLASLLAGASLPALGLFLSEFMEIFSAPPEEQEDLSNQMVGMTMGLAAFTTILRITMSALLAVAGASLTMRIRQMAFKSIMNQDIAFFDDPENQVSSLTTRLSNDATIVQKATGNQVANVLEALAAIISALVIAFTASWKMALVVLAFLPLMGVLGFMHSKFMMGQTKSSKKEHEEAGRTFSEAVDNIRTVVSLTREEAFCTKLNVILDQIFTKAKKKTAANSALFGVTTSIVFFAYAAAMTYGSYLVQTEHLPYSNVFRVFTAILFTGQIIGRNTLVGSEYVKAKLATSRLLRIIDRKPAIDITCEDGEKPTRFSGTVSFKNVHFRYPVRKDVVVLSGLEFELQQGQTLALVGESGCGKSTIVQLIDRFYDPEKGVVQADNYDIATLNLKWLRSHIGIVSQEPSLFACSIAKNIAYGDNSREVPMDKIISAARVANIHNFIQSLPDGYETNAGSKGTQLSGGQKQRVAIARALVGDPKILLLDEATSALDTESEKIVQEALDRAREGRTCLVIAHRLSTIQNADKIAIIHKGEIVELGTHSELMSQRGIYYNLQQTSKKKS